MIFSAAIKDRQVFSEDSLKKSYFVCMSVGQDLKDVNIIILRFRDFLLLVFSLFKICYEK